MPDQVLAWAPAIRIVATPSAIDALDDAPDGHTHIRVAADELLVISLGDGAASGEMTAPAVADSHAIVVEDGGWQQVRLPRAEAEALLDATTSWAGTVERSPGAVSQGMVAGIPIKLVAESDHLVFVFQHAVGNDFAARVFGAGT